jgi:hypothetical protein
MSLSRERGSKEKRNPPLALDAVRKDHAPLLERLAAEIRRRIKRSLGPVTLRGSLAAIADLLPECIGA